MSKLRLIVLQTEKGGAGKTTVADALVAGLVAGGSRVAVLDADDGNSGFLRRCGKASALPMSWNTGADALPKWLDAHLNPDIIDTVVVDCGANLIASGAPLNGFLGQWIVDVEASGGSVVAMAVASTNAPGTGRLVSQMRDAYGSLGQVRLIKNDQDGSGAFDRSLATVGMTSAIFPHISPGIFAARLLEARPLLEMFREPPLPYAEALARYAAQVSKFLSDPAVADLIVPAGVEQIRSYGAHAPEQLHFAVQRLDHATDRKLRANASVFQSRQMLIKAGAMQPRNDAAIATSALAVLSAETEYTAIFK